MRIGSMDINGAPVLNKDFGGSKFGPDARSFSTIIEDPELQDRLSRDGVKLYYPPKAPGNAEPPAAYLSVRVDNRYNDVDLVGVFPDGTVCRYDDRNYHDLDKLWIKSADMYIVLNRWEKNGRSGVTAYLKTGVIHFMSDEERNERQKEYEQESDPIKQKYAKYF